MARSYPRLLLPRRERTPFRRAACALTIALTCASLACTEAKPPPPTPAPIDLLEHCREAIGPERVEKVTDGVWVARGFDLANTILIQTSEGHVVVDVGLSPERAVRARRALLAKAPGRIAAIVMTHSHADHIGGASAWVEPAPGAPAGERPDIWATEAFAGHLFKQYGLFRPIEARRAARQFGAELSREALPCTGIGPTIDLDGATRSGVRLPNRTFSGRTSFEVGGREIVLIETPGETHDQLAVWLPDIKAVLPGDNYYAAFPNLYTIRGTSNRPVADWVRSLDALRALNPEILIPSHTGPIVGAAKIQDRLTAYRDAIQYVHDDVVRRANRGEGIDAIAAAVRLPPHLLARPELAPLYGEVSWSARGIYGGALGWFDGEPEALYPLEPAEAAKLDVELIGRGKLVAKASEAIDAKRPELALHLLRKLARAGDRADDLKTLRAEALRLQAARTQNTNGRAYLLVSALEVERSEQTEARRVTLDEEMVDSIPLEVFFRNMPTRLKPEEADVHTSVQFAITEGQPPVERVFHVTIRRGIAEVFEGPEPLPGTPKAVARLSMSAASWRRIALQVDSPLDQLLSGDLEIEGDILPLVDFLRRFERGF